LRRIHLWVCLQRFINEVEKFCFGEEGQHHGSTILNRTQSRACLALGSLAKHCQNAGHHEMADTLVGKLESWLEKHAEGICIRIVVSVS
jgi:hypothetical protein